MKFNSIILEGVAHKWTPDATQAGTIPCGQKINVHMYPPFLPGLASLS